MHTVSFHFSPAFVSPECLFHAKLQSERRGESLCLVGGGKGEAESSGDKATDQPGLLLKMPFFRNLLRSHRPVRERSSWESATHRCGHFAWGRGRREPT